MYDLSATRSFSMFSLVALLYTSIHRLYYADFHLSCALVGPISVFFFSRNHQASALISQFDDFRPNRLLLLFSTSNFSWFFARSVLRYFSFCANITWSAVCVCVWYKWTIFFLFLLLLSLLKNVLPVLAVRVVDGFSWYGCSSYDCSCCCCCILTANVLHPCSMHAIQKMSIQKVFHNFSDGKIGHQWLHSTSKLDKLHFDLFSTCNAYGMRWVNWWACSFWIDTANFS